MDQNNTQGTSNTQTTVVFQEDTTHPSLGNSDPDLILNLRESSSREESSTNGVKGILQKNKKGKKKKPSIKVNWTEDVIDNEHMNKRKSNSKPSYPLPKN